MSDLMEAQTKLVGSVLAPFSIVAEHLKPPGFPGVARCWIEFCNIVDCIGGLFRNGVLKKCTSCC